MENNTTNHITDTSSVNLKTTNEKIQRNYAEFNQSWGRFNDIIKQVKQECLERVTNLEHENSVLQQRYKELEERVLPLTTSLNEQEYLKEFLKFLCTSQINANVNLTETQNGDSKNSDAIEQLTSLLLYTNITQKDILMNCHQLHQRVAQLEQINSILCSIICDGGFISPLDKIRTTDYGNSSSNETQTTGEEQSTPGNTRTHLKLSDIFCKINDSLKSFGISSHSASHSYFHDSIKENHELQKAFLPVHTTDTTEMNTVNDSNNNNTNLFHSTLNSLNNSPTRQSTSSNNNTVNVQNLSHDYHGYTYPTNCTIQNTGLYLNKDLTESCSSAFTSGLQLNKNTRSHNIQEKNSITGEWIRSKSLPVLVTNSQQTNTENESCLRTNSLTQLIHLPALFPITSYPIKRVTEQMMLLSENLLKSETEFDILKSSQHLNLPCGGHLTNDLIPNNTQQNTTVWLDKPLPKGWIQLQNLPYSGGLQRETIGTHSHMILGARSLPLLFNKPIESWKKASTTTISSSPLSVASGENYRVNSLERVHSFRNLHSNGFHHLKTIIEVDSGPPSFHELLSQSVHSNHNDNHINKHESQNHNNNNINNNSPHDPEKVDSTASPNVYISPNHSIEFLPNSRQILCRDQKLRYHYPLRSAVLGSNPEASNHFHIPKSYDLETQTNYHDAFRKLRNARKNLRFGVFSDTELLTGKFTITSTDDSAIDSGDEDFHSSVDSLHVKSFLTKSEVKTTTSCLTTTAAQNNCQNNRIIPSIYASGSNCNLSCKSDIPLTNGDINEVKGAEDSQYAHTEHELNTSHVQNQGECNNSLKNIPNGKHDIEHDRKQVSQ
ncbi:unnamed protein product [Trichobilharzia szidati]|nr:unnamed protein product [Trichobilharzia szidati]